VNLFNRDRGAAENGAGPPAPAPEEIPVLDLQVLEEMGIVPGSVPGSLPSEIIAIFLREESPRMERLAGLASERNVPALVQAAHNVAGSSAIIGARQTQEAAIALELAARAQAWPDVAAHLAALEAAWTRLRAALVPYQR